MTASATQVLVAPAPQGSSERVFRGESQRQSVHELLRVGLDLFAAVGLPLDELT